MNPCDVDEWHRRVDHELGGSGRGGVCSAVGLGASVEGSSARCPYRPCTAGIVTALARASTTPSFTRTTSLPLDGEGMVVAPAATDLAASLDRADGA